MKERNDHLYNIVGGKGEKITYTYSDDDDDDERVEAERKMVQREDKNKLLEPQSRETEGGKMDTLVK